MIPSVDIQLLRKAGVSLIGCWLLVPANVHAADTASVGVEIRIEPYAFVEFPDGFDFVLRVREHEDHHHGHRDDDDDDPHRGGHDDDRGRRGDNVDRHGDNGSAGKSDGPAGHRGGSSRQSGQGNSVSHGDGRSGHDEKREAVDNAHRGGDHNRDGPRHDNRHGNSRGRGHEEHGNGHGYGHHHVWYSVDPVFIPFKVRGNATASVSARPVEFMRINGGLHLGESHRVSGTGHGYDGDGSTSGNRTGHGHGPPQFSSFDGLAYNIVVQFPIVSWQAAGLDGWDGLGGFWNDFASLPGTERDGTPPLVAEVAGRPNGVLGMIYVLSKPGWTRDGRTARPGKYTGSLEVFVTADE